MVNILAVSLSSKSSGAGLTKISGIPMLEVVVLGAVVVLRGVVVVVPEPPPPTAVVVVEAETLVLVPPLPLPSSVEVVVDAGVVVVDDDVEVEYASAKKVWERSLIVLRSLRVGVI